MKKVKYNVLIAGYTGFIGSSLVKRLEDNELFNLTLISKSNGFNLEDGLELGDIHCDVVINLSGVTNIDESWSNPHKYFKTNYLLTLSLLEYSRISGAKFIQISSYTYGVPSYQPIDEKHPVKGYNPYASSKILSDQLCEDYSKHYNIPITILKLFNIYGDGQSDRFIIKNLIKSVLNGDELQVRDLQARRDYLWIDDFVDAVIRVVVEQESGFSVYNIGSGVSYSAKDIIDFISLFVNDVRYTSDISPSSKLLIQDCICDNRLFSKKFNWSPKVSLKDGIQKIIYKETHTV
jgi:nucleoside-diphosphate-sugar epimerase